MPAPTSAPTPDPPPQKFVEDVLDDGVVIVVSTSSQQMHVFRDGGLWRTSPVSTGKRGKETPSGVFAILQKKKFHRSNLYNNAPMPFMQRLTWDGIAIHAGKLPGYPASHGCIRLPSAFAKELFRVTGHTSTAVIVVDEPLANDEDALALAKQTDAAIPISPKLLAKKPPVRAAAKRTIPARKSGAGQTIQLAATLSPELATARWDSLVKRRPELAEMRMAVIPAVVNGTQFYRLRVSASDAHAKCSALKRAGIECFPVG
ncbi:L,D-transpeptidase family protein [uncultured Erythrobacter sp.]|uniref:L,D-transpeptidase family protein n=1 Tax=uncultured Erythrobacter sp. TaxID=263913 RepID=UPI00262E6175|nr:L,D-transpeptidase family protein [uncultured Erythrobacter sp.]